MAFDDLDEDSIEKGVFQHQKLFGCIKYKYILSNSQIPPPKHIPPSPPKSNLCRRLEIKAFPMPAEMRYIDCSTPPQRVSLRFIATCFSMVCACVFFFLGFVLPFISPSLLNQPKPLTPHPTSLLPLSNPIVDTNTNKSSPFSMHMQ